MFKLRKINIKTKYDFIAVLREKDAKELSLNPNEKIKVFLTHNKDKYVICKLEIISENKKNKKEIGWNCLKNGEIGLVEITFEKLNSIEGKSISISPAPKPKSLEYIKKKFNGCNLSENNFLEIAEDIINNKYTEIETTYFVLACTAHKLSDKEITGLTKAMVKVGKTLDFKKNKNDIIVDKHCIGGVPNNRTTMLVVPIIAAAGLKIPKTSSRSITSPAGTADTMEVLANVDIPLTKMFNIVNENNGCIVWGGALDLSPADDIIIHVEHPLELDSEGQMIASILSKKKSAGSTHVLIDIPIGKYAKIKNKIEGLKLKNKFEKVGKAIGLKIKCIITNGNQPIGNGIGPLLEAKDVLSILNLEKNAPQDLKEKSLIMAGLILEMSGIVKKGKGYDKAREILNSGKALEKFNKIIDEQGRKELPKKAKYTLKIKSKKEGKIKEMNNKQISKLAFILGAPEDKSAGLILLKKLGEKIKKEEELLELHTNSKQKLKYAENYIENHPEFILIK